MKQVNLGFYRMVLFLLLGLFTSVIAYSQQISVKGIVKDQIGEPVIGANVLVRGTTNCYFYGKYVTRAVAWCNYSG